MRIETLSPVAQAADAPLCPMDLSALREVAPSSPEQVAAAVRRARRAQDAWRATSISARAELLRAAAKEMLARRHEVMELVRAELGKPDAEALFNEALGPLDAVNAWASLVQKHCDPHKVSLNPVAFPGKSASVERVARGVIGVIAPWNFPAAGLYRSVFPALLTGNGVVLKPSERAPRSSAWLIEVLASKLPDGLVGAVHGDGRVGQSLLDAGIDACVFTGSVAAGRAVRVRCAELGIPCSAEMGGNDAAIVLEDCAMPRTVAGITAWALNNAGQACGGVEVAYVDQAIADAFVARLGRAWSRLRAAPGRRGETDVGPLSNRAQFEKVQAHVADAVAKGAKVVCGGAPTGVGYYFAPTVLDRCTDAMDVVREETFGPVLAVVRVEGAADAVARVNAGRYGLGASIWTRDLDRAKRLAERLDVGVVTVNNHAFTGAIPSLPWSGTRDTGFGVANSEHSLSTFVRPKAVVIDRGEGMEIYWPPYDRALLELGDILSDAQRAVLGRAWKLPLLLRERARAVTGFFREEGDR
ncbi:MAG: aldehyde dehydrogenase family protein [Polyangiales bacterium]